MRVVQTVRELRAAVAALREEGGRIGFVPTMGALHEGHLSLFDRAADLSDHVVASIYVNPLQFGEREDLNAYPRDLAGDLEKAEGRGVAIVFTPPSAEMYPEGQPMVTVDPGPLAERLCGRYRPGHFRGVLTVVAKLFGMVTPDIALFGRKDFQQGVLIRRMVRDLNLSVEVVLAPIVREEDGLALSSRNAYLDAEERRQAVGLSRALAAARDAFRSGTDRSEALLAQVHGTLGAYPGLTPQYVELVDPDTLEPVDDVRPGSVLALAAHCGTTRLIDNAVLGDPHE